MEKYMPSRTALGNLLEKSPPGWEGTVKAMKKHPEIDNPWALAWSMKKKGAKSHYKLNKRKQPVKAESLASMAAGLRALLEYNDESAQLADIQGSLDDLQALSDTLSDVEATFDAHFKGA